MHIETAQNREYLTNAFKICRGRTPGPHLSTLSIKVRTVKMAQATPLTRSIVLFIA